MSIKDTVSLTNVERAIKAAQALHDVELKEALADTKLDLVNAKNVIADLTEDKRILEEKLRLQDDVVYDDNGIAWIKEEPFCGGCLGSRNNKIRLSYHTGNYYNCPACKAGYGDVNIPKKPAPGR